MRAFLYVGISGTFLSLWLLHHHLTTDPWFFVRTIVSMLWNCRIVLLASLSATVCCGQQVLDLSAVQWTLTSPNFTNISVPAKIPSQAHLDLYAAKV